MEILHKDRHTISVELAVTASAFGDDWRFSAFVHDISDRRRHQAELAEARDRALEASRMKSEYAVLRGFQIHDIFHLVTGYKTTGWGEMALQAFTLAQRPLPYASLWMATLTAQMTFIRPDMTVAVMDALSQGWQHGRTAKNLNYERWEDRFGDDVGELRIEFGLAAPVARLG